jgi:cytochrome b561
VFLVLFQFFSSLLWPAFHRPTRHLLINWHMTFGITLGVVVIVRLVWRFIPGHRVAPAVGGLEERLATGVHYGLYSLLIFQFLLGFVLRWSGAESMWLFGLTIPSPVAGEVSDATNDLIGDVHKYSGYVIVAIAAGHASMALYHRFVLRDGILRRMLPHRT